MDSQQTLFTVQQRLKSQARQSIRQMQTLREEQHNQRIKEELFIQTKKRILEEFEESNQLIKIKQSPQQWEIKYKQMIDKLENSNKKKIQQLGYLNSTIKLPSVKESYKSPFTLTRLSKIREPSERTIRSVTSFDTSLPSSQSNSQMLQMSSFWKKPRVQSYENPAQRFLLVSSEYIPSDFHFNEDTLNTKLSELINSNKICQNAVIDSKEKRLILQNKLYNIQNEINKISNKIEQERKKIEDLSQNDYRFQIIIKHLKDQEILFKFQALEFTEEMNSINERAEKIVYNKQSIINNLGIETKEPYDYYALGRMEYNRLIPIKWNQGQRIENLQEQEGYLQEKLESMKQTVQQIETLLNLRHFFFSHFLSFNWTKQHQNVKTYLKKNSSIKSTKNILILAISQVLVKAEQEMSQEVLKNGVDKFYKRNVTLNNINILYMQHPQGPQHLVDELIFTYRKMDQQLNILTLDACELNQAKQQKVEQLQEVENQLICHKNQLNKKEAQQLIHKFQLDLGEYEYLANHSIKQTKQLNTLTYLRSISQKNSFLETLFMRIFSNSFEQLIKIMQMTDLTNTKMSRYLDRIKKKCTLANISEELDFIFTIKDNILKISQDDYQHGDQGNIQIQDTFSLKMTELVKFYFPLDDQVIENIQDIFINLIKRNNLIYLFCKKEDYELFLSKILEKINNFQEVVDYNGIFQDKIELLQNRAYSNYFSWIKNIFTHSVNMVQKLKNFKASDDDLIHQLKPDDRRIIMMNQNNNFRILQETQRKISERLQKYLNNHENPNDYVYEHRSLKKQQLSQINLQQQEAIGKCANLLQLNKIKNMKSSIIIEKRKLEAQKIREQAIKQREREKSLDNETLELLHITKTQGTIKGYLKTEPSENNKKDEDLVEQIQTLRQIQYNNSQESDFHRRLWSNQIFFNENDNIKKTLNTHKGLLQQIFRESYKNRMTSEQKQTQRKKLQEIKLFTQSQRKEKTVERLRQRDFRSSFIVLTSRSDYMRKVQGNDFELTSDTKYL